MKIIVPDWVTRRLVPNIDASNLLEIFLISSVSSLLLIRAYLQITGYPQLGGGDFHIAHMLWGGLFMLLAIIINLSFLNTTAKYITAVLGGIGFGTFIDELGKFITTTNDYFYQPTIGLIYIIFMILFFITKLLETYSSFSNQTYTINAVEHLKEVIRHDLDDHERKLALSYLDQVIPPTQISKNLYQLIETAQYTPRKVTWLSRLNHHLSQNLAIANNSHLVSNIVIAVYTIASIRNLFVAYLAHVSNATHLNWLYLSTSIFVCLLTLSAVIQLLNKKYSQAYRMIYISILISIFFIQIFLFRDNQFAALYSLVLFVATYVVIKQKLRIDPNTKKVAQ